MCVINTHIRSHTYACKHACTYMYLHLCIGRSLNTALIGHVVMYGSRHLCVYVCMWARVDVCTCIYAHRLVQWSEMWLCMPIDRQACMSASGHVIMYMHAASCVHQGNIHVPRTTSCACGWAFTEHVQWLYIHCTVSVQYLYSICTVSVQYLL